MSRRALRYPSFEALQSHLGNAAARAAAADVSATPAPTSKYSAIATVVDGIRFDSKLEARRYGELRRLQAAKEIRGFLRQVPVHMPEGTRLVVDFLVFPLEGQPWLEDTKGVETAVFRVKRRAFLHHYPWLELRVLKR